MTQVSTSKLTVLSNQCRQRKLRDFHLLTVWCAPSNFTTVSLPMIRIGVWSSSLAAWLVQFRWTPCHPLRFVHTIKWVNALRSSAHTLWNWGWMNSTGRNGCQTQLQNRSKSNGQTADNKLILHGSTLTLKDPPCIKHILLCSMDCLGNKNTSWVAQQPALFKTSKLKLTYLLPPWSIVNKPWAL